jgi:hypothetical protein
MRKLTLILGLSLFTSSAHALRVGVHGGVNIANLSYNTPVTTSSRTGIVLGGILETGLSSYFSIQTGADYIQKGWVSGTTTTKLDYFEVPLLLRLNLPFPILTPFAYAGPTLGFMMSGKTQAGTAAALDIKSTLNTTEFGMAFGGGFELGMSPFASLIAQLRYGIGFSDLDKSAATSTKNKGLLISAGFLFGL